jgi:hypothetical protein
MGEQFLDIAGVTFGSITDKYFLGVNLGSPAAKIVGGDSLTEKLIPLLRPVSLKSRILGHFVDSFMESLDAGCRQAFGNITYAEFNDITIRVVFLKGCDSFGDIGEKVGRLKFQVMLIDCNHLEVSRLFYKEKELTWLQDFS